jgi:excisionase family DNA binding protein
MLKNEPEVLTVTEAAKILRIGKNKAYDLIKTGKLSSIKMGGKIIVPKMFLVRFLTDTDNFQMSSRIVSDNPWTSNGKWYAVINLYNTEGRRKEKWASLDLEAKRGTKTEANHRMNELLTLLLLDS